MKTVYIVHGLKRSGNHAIINWLLAQQWMPFFNNIIPVSPILRGQKAMPLPVALTDWLGVQESTILRRFALRNRRRVMVSLEDHSVTTKIFEGGDHQERNILVLRDPENLFASRIRKSSLTDLAAYPKENDEVMRRARDLWIEHARECLGETDHLCNKMCVYFNRWYSDQKYRRAISEQLGFTFTDAGVKTISPEGGGSSFDRTDYDGMTEKLNVLGRTEMLSSAEQDLLEAVISVPELRRLSGMLDSSIEVSNRGG